MHNQSNGFIAVFISASAGIVTAMLAQPAGEDAEHIHLKLDPLPTSAFLAGEFMSISDYPEVLKVSRLLLSDKSLMPLEFKDQEPLMGFSVSISPASFDHRYIDRFVCNDIDTVFLAKAEQQTVYSKRNVNVALDSLDSMNPDEEDIDASSAKLLADNVRARLNKAMMAVDQFEQDVAGANFCPERAQRADFYYDTDTQFFTLSAEGYQRALSTEEMVSQILSTARINHEQYNDQLELRAKRKRLLDQVAQIDAELAEAGK
ncbi:hypothetical protein RYA05_03700 [Pseudomonas syringae pv. actinidiae]|nr:hypothetical protein [Pseudomonas syringae pv. actinidiae]